MNLFELFIKIAVDDDASGNIDKLSQKMGKGLQTAAKIGVAAVGTAAAAIATMTKQSVDAYSEYEQLAGGAAKIFDQMNQTKILTDAQNAYKDLGLSASQYLAVMNDVGATFASTMGDEKGYNTARQGLQAISDYASGTGKNVDLLSEKFMMITRSSASYQSIADQFSGILPATSAAFLEQAQAAGILEDKYKKITEVPIDEYQEAVAKMLEKGVEALGLSGNTAAEAENTISGSLAAAKASWENLIVGFSDANADVDILLDNFIESVVIAVDNIVPVVSRAFPRILNAGKEIIKNLLNGIINSQNAVSKGATETIRTIVDVIGEMLPLVLQAGVKIIGQLLMGAIQSIPSLLVLGVHILEAVQSAVWTVSNGLAQVGFYIVEGIQKGVSNAWGNFLSWFTNLFNLLIEDVKNILGIASPSKVFKEIGKFAAEGFGIGFEDEFENVKNGIEKELSFDAFSTRANIKTGESGLAKIGSAYQHIIDRNAITLETNVYNQTYNDVFNKVSNTEISDFYENFERLSYVEEIDKKQSEISDFFETFEIGNYEENLIKNRIVNESETRAVNFVPVEKYISDLERSERRFSSEERTEYYDNQTQTRNTFGNIYINVEGAKYNNPYELAQTIAAELQNLIDRKAAVYA